MSTLSNYIIGEQPFMKHRFLGFLIWQTISSFSLYSLSKLTLFSFFTPTPKLTPSLLSLFLFLTFLLFNLLFSTALHLICSPQQPLSFASPLELLFGVFRLLFLSGAQPVGSEGRRRVGVSLGFVGFVGVCGVSGAVAVGCVYWSCMEFGGGFKGIGFKGFVVGLVYGLVFVFKKRWIVEFPIVQRPLFFSFKMGIPSSTRRALKLSCTGYLISTLLALFLPNEFKSMLTLGKFINEQILLFIGIFVVFMCWELSLHLHQVLHTKRYSFAPPKGSAAAETNPSEPLLAALEESTAKTLLQYLAFLDLYMVCEGNANTWRRAAFFEETGETYKRVIAVCLRPLEQLAVELGECVETDSVDAFKVSSQLKLPTERVSDSRLEQAFYNIQLCTWSAEIIASLTVHSRREDRFGVAQLTESNASVVSTLVSCLLAVELCMGKKTNVHSAQYLMGPAGIKWATLSNGKRVPAVSTVGKRKGSPLYSKAYVMADILRTSIYRIVSAFHKEMLDSTKSGLHDKDWIISTKPCYGSRELLLQKLNLFLNFEACSPCYNCEARRYPCLK